MSKVIRLMSKTDLVKNCLNYFKEVGVPSPDRSTIFHYLAKCFPGMYFKTILTIPRLFYGLKGSCVEIASTEGNIRLES